jgi:hypothetical protein
MSMRGSEPITIEYVTLHRFLVPPHYHHKKTPPEPAEHVVLHNSTAGNIQLCCVKFLKTTYATSGASISICWKLSSDSPLLCKIACELPSWHKILILSPQRRRHLLFCTPHDLPRRIRRQHSWRRAHGRSLCPPTRRIPRVPDCPHVLGLKLTHSSMGKSGYFAYLSKHQSST